MPSIVIAGCTGLIGTELTRQLQSAASCEVILLARKTFAPASPHHKVIQTDFADLTLDPPTDSDSLALCALGTTIKTAGSKASFAAVDLDMVVKFAEAAKQAGYQRFGVVSSIGADANSHNFYLQTKGKMESALEDIGFEQLLIVRPSLLLGDRKDFRLGEGLAQTLAPILTPILFGPFKKYRPVSDYNVARALLDTNNYLNGTRILESHQLQPCC